jgi:hypothetical protein
MDRWVGGGCGGDREMKGFRMEGVGGKWEWEGMRKRVVVTILA